MREQNTKCTKFFCHEIFIMKSFFAGTFGRNALEQNVRFNHPQYYIEEPIVSNKTEAIEYNYFWLGTGAINSEGSTYSDSGFGSNELIDLTNKDNTLTYFGKYTLSNVQKNSLTEFYKSYPSQGTYSIMFNYGKNKESTTQPVMIFSGFIYFF